MIKMTLQLIDQAIESNKKEANLLLKAGSTSRGRRKKTRIRTKGEVEALNQISITRWKKAVEANKIKKIGERVFYYDYR